MASVECRERRAEQRRRDALNHMEKLTFAPATGCRPEGDSEGRPSEVKQRAVAATDRSPIPVPPGSLFTAVNFADGTTIFNYWGSRGGNAAAQQPRGENQ